MRWVGAKASLDVVEQREGEREDGSPWLTRSGYSLVHRHATYDIEVDTGCIDPIPRA